jgi:hypothetical protein
VGLGAGAGTTGPMKSRDARPSGAGAGPGAGPDIEANKHTEPGDRSDSNDGRKKEEEDAEGGRDDGDTDGLHPRAAKARREDGEDGGGLGDVEDGGGSGDMGILETQVESPGEQKRKHAALIRWFGVTEPPRAALPVLSAPPAPPPLSSSSSRASSAARIRDGGGSNRGGGGGNASSCGTCRVPRSIADAWASYAAGAGAGAGGAASEDEFAQRLPSLLAEVRRTGPSALGTVASAARRAAGGAGIENDDSDVEVVAVATVAPLMREDKAKNSPSWDDPPAYVAPPITFPKPVLRPELIAANCRVLTSPSGSFTSAVGSEGAGSQEREPRESVRLWHASSREAVLKKASPTHWRKEPGKAPGAKSKVASVVVPADDEVKSPLKGGSPLGPTSGEEDEEEREGEGEGDDVVVQVGAEEAEHSAEAAVPDLAEDGAALRGNGDEGDGDVLMSTPQLRERLESYGLKPGTREYMQATLKDMLPWSPRPHAVYVPADVEMTEEGEAGGRGTGGSASIGVVGEGEGDAEGETETETQGAVSEALALLLRNASDVRRRALLLQSIPAEELEAIAREGGLRAGRAELLDAAEGLGLRVGGRWNR